MMRYGWLALVLVLGAVACREPDGPMGGASAGILVVTSDPPGGRILLDGKSTGQLTPDTLRGVAGLRQITVELDTAQLKYRYAAQVVVPGTGEPLTLNGPLMARCQAGAADCASPFRRQYELGAVRFASNALGMFFLQAGQGHGLYWPGNTENSYVSTATPVVGALLNGTPVSTGVYDTDFFAGRPAPSTVTSGGNFTLTQSTWMVPSGTALQFAAVRGLEIRERLLTSTSVEAAFLVELRFRNISNNPLYAVLDPAVGQLGGVTLDEAYIGLAVDPDIGSAEGESDDDWVSYDGSLATVFAYDAALLVPGYSISQNSPALVGLRVLEKPAGTEVALNAWTRQTAADWEGATSTQVAGYGMLSGKASYNPDYPGTLIGHMPATQGDVRMVAAVGPVRLAPGDSARVVLALALAPPTPGTFTSGTNIPAGDPEDGTRQLYAVAAQLRERLVAAEALLPALRPDASAPTAGGLR